MDFPFLTSLTKENVDKMRVFVNEKVLLYKMAGCSIIERPRTDKLPKIWYAVKGPEVTTDSVTPCTTQKEFDIWQSNGNLTDGGEEGPEPPTATDEEISEAFKAAFESLD